MSHVTSYKTNIRLKDAIDNGRDVEQDPGWELLENAVHSAAEEFNMYVSHAIKDYYGRAILCDWALTGPNFPRGIGINVDRKTGEVSFVSDTYGGFESIAGEIKDRIVQNFSAICVAKALKALNYTVDMDEVKHPVEGKKVILRGVL